MERRKNKEVKMSKFKRKAPPAKIYKKPWDDPEYDALRPDKKRISARMTEEECFSYDCDLARKMKHQFGWRTWMIDFIDENENNKPFRKGILV